MAQPFSSQERWIVSLVGVSHMMSHTLMLVFPAVLINLQSEFGLTLFQLGKIQTVAFLLYGAGALPGGILVDILGARNLLLVFLFGASLSSILAGLTSSLTPFVISVAAIGLFGSLYHPSGLTYISRTVVRRSTALGFHGIAGSVGLALSPGIAGYIASVSNWRYAYILFGISGMILATLVALLLKPSHRTNSELPTQQETQNKKIPLVLFYIAMILIGLSYRGFMTFFPAHFSTQSPHFMTTLNILFKGGLLTTLVLIAGIPGQYLGGLLGDTFRKEKLMFLIIGLNIPLLFFISGTTDLSLFIIALVFGFIHFSFQPIGNGILASYTHSSRRGLGYGIQFFLSFGVGSFAASIAGYIAEHQGVNVVFSSMGYILIPVLFIAAVLIYLETRFRS